MENLPYTFRDPSLLELALTHSSTGASANNERLEFLGDAALDLAVAEELYKAHSELAEGALTEMKSSVVSRRALATAAHELGLETMAKVGRGLSNRTLSRSVLANLYEAVLGAVYLDGGYEAARVFSLETLARPLGEVRNKESTSNPKQTLQELCQKHWNQPPEYKLIERRGLAHARAFLVAAVTPNGDGKMYPSAWGRTRKEAEQWAAFEALLVLDDEGVTP